MDHAITRLSNTLLLEILDAIGLPKRQGLAEAIRPLFRKATEHMASIGVTFDRLVEESGFPKAAEWALTNWCTNITVRGLENIPPFGPLLVVSNHPGTYDALVITSYLKRGDIRIIASSIPFLKFLPYANRHFFFVSKDAQERMLGARAAVRYLQQGGAVLIYGTGRIDPDPAVNEQAIDHLERWFSSINLFLRTAPQTRLLLAVVSHAVAPKWIRHPITWLRKKGLDKRRLAEFGQVLQQLFRPGSLYLSPRLSFAAPTLPGEFLDAADPLQEIIRRAKVLMADHMRWTGTLTDTTADSG